MGSKNDKNQEITRSKQQRRKLLKSMAAGSGAIVAGKTMPDEWAKPVVDSVVLPAHAQASLVCSVRGSMTPYYVSDSTIQLDPVSIPGSETINFGSTAEVGMIPNISVTPGITDPFSLTTALSGDFGTPTTGTDQVETPDPVNGQIPFNSISVPSFDGSVTFTTTLSPSNPNCGGDLVVTITFED